MSRTEKNWSDLEAAAADRAERSRLRHLVDREHLGVEIRQGDRRWINFGSNDYLGLATRPHRPLHNSNRGAGSSALVTGWTTEHQMLAKKIASFERMPAGLIFSSGFAACIATVPALAGPNDLILSDRLNHASLIDGCRLAAAKVTVYPHRDVEFLRQVLRRDRDRYHRVWIVTDGVFSMDGTLAPLSEICNLAQQYNVDTIVDEAHATGVLGLGGRGVCEAVGVENEVSIRIGTFSKSFGVQGGFVVSDKPVIEHLINHGRGFVYSTAMSPMLVSAILDSLREIESSETLRSRVQCFARKVRAAFDINIDEPDSLVPIVAIQVGSDQSAIAASQWMSDRGLLVPAIRPPTVPEGQARLRISLSAAHTNDQIEQLCDAAAGLRTVFKSIRQ